MFNDFNYYQAYYCYGLVVYIAFHSLINRPVLGMPTTKHHVGNKIKEFDKIWTSPTRLERGTLHLRISQTIHIGVDRWSTFNQSSSSVLQPELSVVRRLQLGGIGQLGCVQQFLFWSCWAFLRT